MNLVERALTAGNGLVRQAPSLSATLSRWHRAGLLRRILPGVYCLASGVGWRTRVRALSLVDPSAVVTGAAAAALTWWPELEVTTVDATRRSHVASAPGYRWSRRMIPEDVVVELDGGVRITSAAATVVDLIPVMGGAVIDEALRRGACTLADLWDAFRALPHRRGNEVRRLLLGDSRDEPWSEAERAFHRILRRQGLLFTGNHAVRVPGHAYVLDAALAGVRLGFEVDGRAFHQDARTFVDDRVRDVELALIGWRIHRFAARTVMDDPEWVGAVVTELIRQRCIELGVEGSRLRAHRRIREIRVEKGRRCGPRGRPHGEWREISMG